MGDRWTSIPVVMQGGLMLDKDVLTLGTEMPGAAIVLQNYEPSIEGGYHRVQGHAKWDTNAVTGTGNVLGVLVGFDGVFACRKNASSYDINFSSGSGWSTINSAARNNAVSKARGIRYSVQEEAVCLVDGANPALKYNGTTDTLINGTNAPTAPAYAAEFRNRLALAPASSAETFILSAPNDDEDFTSGGGAIEFNCNDKIVGIKKFRDNLYIFCENSIQALVGSTSADFILNNVTDNIGCLSGDSIVEIGGDLLFLAPDGVRSLAATERIGDIELGIASRPIQDVLTPKIGNVNPREWSALSIRAKSQYRLMQYTAGIDDVDGFGIIGKVETRQLANELLPYEWATISGINATCADSAYDDDDEISVFGQSSGFVQRLEVGNSFDGADISYVYQTPYFTFSDVTIRKVLQKLSLFMSIEGALDVAFNVKYDFEDTGVKQPRTIELVANTSGARYGTAQYGVSAYAGPASVKFKKRLVGSGFTASFVFSGTDSNAPHRIDSFQIEFAPKGRR